MYIDELTEYCLAKKGVSHGFPFGGDTLVFKVMNKMFALTGIDSVPLTVNLKCDPENIEQLRDDHPEIIPGYHMNKSHWNTVMLEGDLSDSFIYGLIDHSYDLIVASFPKKIKVEFDSL